MLKPEEIARINHIDSLFKETFNDMPRLHFKSTGRLEIIGNHVDHNSGICMVSSVDNLNMFAAVSLGKDNRFVLKSEGYHEIDIKINDLVKRESEQGKSIALVRGILFRFLELGYKIGPIFATMDSNIYKGAGVSSSAAYCVLICKILSYYFNNDKMDTVTIAKIARYAENVYFGKSSGLLDQIGCCSKGFSLVDFKDQENPVVTLIAPNFDGYKIILINSMTDHSRTPDAYTSIPKDMKFIASLFNKKYLREVNEKEFLEKYKVEKSKNPRAWSRAFHFFMEDNRVLQAFSDIKNNNIKGFFKEVNESGLSSENYLKNVLLEGEKTNNFELALHMARENIKDGAVRVHGGGFGGTIICFVKNEEVPGFVDKMATIFKKENINEVQTCLDPLRLIKDEEIK